MGLHTETYTHTIPAWQSPSKKQCEEQAGTFPGAADGKDIKKYFPFSRDRQGLATPSEIVRDCNEYQLLFLKFQQVQISPITIITKICPK